MDCTSGLSAAPSGFGYANASGLATGLEGRLFFGGRHGIFFMGVMAGAQHQAGPLLGAVDGYAFRTTLMEAGLTARVLLPCLSQGDVKWRLGGVLALVGAYADAGTGVGGQRNGPAADARAAAAASLDHSGLGWRLAFDLSWHVDAFLVGVGAGVRQYFPIGSAIARVWLADVGIRVGARFDLWPAPAARRDPWRDL